jgi:hypothetical protein
LGILYISKSGIIVFIILTGPMSSKIRHELFVFVYNKPDRSTDDAQVKDLLEFIDRNISFINGMGIELVITKYLQQELIDNPAKGQELQRKGTRFPSVVTPTQVHAGYDEIKNIYETNIKSWKEHQSKLETKKVGGVALDPDDSVLDNYYKVEMHSKHKDDEDEDSGLGQSSGLMSQVSLAMADRERKKPDKPIRGIEIPRTNDNVKNPPEDAKSTINRLSAATNISLSSGRNKNGGDDEFDEENNEQDLRMEAAYNNRNEDSTATDV